MRTRLFSLIFKEFLAIWKDPKSRTLILLPPILQLLIFVNAATMEVKNIKLGVIDRSNSIESRELISRFEASRWFKKVVYVKNEKNLRILMNNKLIMAGLLIDDDFNKRVNAKKPTKVQVVLDGRQTNSAGIISSYASQIVSSYDKTYIGQGGAGINIDIRNWFNPNLEFKWYTLVSMITLLSVVTTLLLTSLSIARERELGTFEQLTVSPLRPVEILIGKTVPPLCISVVVTLVMMTIAKLCFNLPFTGNIYLLIFATIVALLSIVGIGLFISSICKTQQQAILGAFTFQMPATLISGFVSPIEDMPQAFQVISAINPLRYHLVIGKGLFLKDMQAPDVIINLIPLMLIALLTLSVATYMFKAKLD